jgi:putative ABC transport system permease protein
VEVVGVVKNSRTEDFYPPNGPYFYMAFAQKRLLPVAVQIRTIPNPESMAQGITELIRSLEPNMPLADVQTMTEALNTRFGVLLFGLAAGLAAAMGLIGLVLAITGVFGVVSYMAAQRTHEIGIRLALGAAPQEILRKILGQGLSIVFLGSLLGILLAFALARIVGHFLLGVSPTDPVIYIGVSAVLMLVALTASYIPARRATRVDPVVALRYE